eukprot:6175128-Pleurochrysis_carterae.AAC.1
MHLLTFLCYLLHCPCALSTAPRCAFVMRGCSAPRLSCDAPLPDFAQLAMTSMNADPEEGAEDRKGCSGHVGKMIFSAG